MRKVGGTRAKTAVLGRGRLGAVVTDRLARPFATGALPSFLMLRLARRTSRDGCSRDVQLPRAVAAALAPRTAAIGDRTC
eukprot:COSAG05_NODE_10323_length_571_cov_1.192797_2_plen_79_part_01